MRSWQRFRRPARSSVAAISARSEQSRSGCSIWKNASARRASISAAVKVFFGAALFALRIGAAPRYDLANPFDREFLRCRRKCEKQPDDFRALLVRRHALILFRPLLHPLQALEAA